MSVFARQGMELLANVSLGHSGPPVQYSGTSENSHTNVSIKK